MSPLSNLKIKYKLTLMLFLPLSGLLLLSFITVLNEAQVVNDIEKLEQAIGLSIKVADIMHSIQAERGTSHLLQLTPDTAEQQWQQRVANTDSQINTLPEFLVEFKQYTQAKAAIHQDLNGMTQALERLPSLRAAVQNATQSQMDILAAYNAINNELGDLVNNITSEHMHQEFIKPILALLNTLNAREKSAQEQALLTLVFQQKHFTTDQFQQFVDLVSQQNVYINATLRRYMSVEQQQYAASLLDRNAIQAIQALRKLAYASNVSHPLPETITDDAGNVRPLLDYWSEVQAHKTDLLGELEGYLIKSLLTHIDTIEARALTNFIVIIVGTGLVILLAFILGYSITTRVSQRLKKVVMAANRIAEGDLNNPIKVDSGDEIGQLLSAFATMQQQLREQINAEQQVTEAALRIKQALDTVNTSVVISDDAYQIIYANQAALDLFEHYAAFTQTELPHLNPTHLMTQELDVFHKDPATYRALFERLQETQRVSLNLEHVMLEYDVNVVLNANGERLGFVLEFHDLTEEMATEEEIGTVIYMASQGEFNRHINLEGKTGFFKTFSQSVNQILGYNQQAVQDMLLIFSALAKGDLTQTIHTEYKGMLEQLKQDANQTVQRLTEVMVTIRDSANTVQKAADEIGQGHVSLTQRTEEQAAALQETAASMEQMTGTVQQNADNAGQAKVLAAAANAQAEQGREIANEAVKAMNRINTSSQKIADIIGVIDDIAFQTNLLALNAAVEAARAGEHGRGFSVVATEVRNLAQRSAAAAKEIKQLIRDSLERVEEGTIFVGQSDQALLEIVNAVKKVTDIVAEIAAASVEQASGIQQVNNVVLQMDSMTQQNAALVEETTAAGELLLIQARRLRKQVAFFHLADQPSQT